MKVVGLLLALAGWLIPLAALPLSIPMGARLGVSIVGIGISLIGILVVLNGAHLKEAMKNAIIDNMNYAHEHGTDRPELADWTWPY